MVEGYENYKDNINIKRESFKVNKIEENTSEKLSGKRMEEIHSYYIKLIKIIINDYLRYPNYYHFFNIENIYRVFVKKKGI